MVVGQRRALLGSVLFVALASVVSLVVACDDSSSSAGGGLEFGCCQLTSRPSVFTLMLGRAKRSADDNCIDGYDGTNPDPNAPGWTQVKDEDGCPVWTPPPNAPTICCGCPIDSLVDAGSDADDGGEGGPL